MSENKGSDGLVDIVRNIAKSAKSKLATTTLALATAGILAQGCYVANAPYVNVRIDTPYSESGQPPQERRRALVVIEGTGRPYFRDCFEYAQTFQDSRRRDGRRTRICTCYYPENPQDGYTCEINVDE